MMAVIPESAPAPLVLVARGDGVATLTLNRPGRLNALDLPLVHALIAALNGVAEDTAVRAVVLTGAGRAFCAGGDLNMWRDACERRDVHVVEGFLLTARQIVLAITSMPKPVIAAVNGPAAGAGCNLALSCGMRIASDQATFAQSSVKLGLFPDFGGTYFLPRLIGAARAEELLATGETIGAAEAFRLGLVSRVVPQDSLDAEAVALARRLADAPPIAMHGIKQVLFVDYRETLQRALDEEIRWQMVCFRSDDCREGMAAYFEKRPPHFLGH